MTPANECIGVGVRPFEYAFPKRLSAMLWAGRHFRTLWLSLLAPKKKNSQQLGFNKYISVAVIDELH